MTCNLIIIYYYNDISYNTNIILCYAVSYYITFYYVMYYVMLCYTLRYIMLCYSMTCYNGLWCSMSYDIPAPHGMLSYIYIYIYRERDIYIMLCMSGGLVRRVQALHRRGGGGSSFKLNCGRPKGRPQSSFKLNCGLNWSTDVLEADLRYWFITIVKL